MATRAAKGRKWRTGTGHLDVDVEHITIKGPDGTDVDAIHARPTGRRARHRAASPTSWACARCSTTCAGGSPPTGSRCAPEPFARAPLEVRGDTEEARMGHVKELDDELQIGDLEAAADYLVVYDDVPRWR